MKMYGGVEVRLNSFLISALDESEWLGVGTGRIVRVFIE
jgi:hypothetical protein